MMGGTVTSQLEQRPVLDTGRAHGLARTAAEAPVDVRAERVRRWIEATLDHRAHEVQAATR
jgi:hypothetical protein